MKKGKFIVLEGIDGSGTTTHAKLLTEWLEDQGYSVELTQEPTTRLIGALIRKNIKTKGTSAILDALLFAADRIDHQENLIKPSMDADKIVISDRYVESSIAYQTAAGLEMGWVQEINKHAEHPDLTIILDIAPEIGLNRKAKTNDKFESVEFLRKVRKIYLQRASTQQYPVINTDNPIEKVQEQLQKLIQSVIIDN